MKNKGYKVDYRRLEKMIPITKIVIEVIPHGTQRYETCGDWFRTVIKDEATLHVLCSKLDPSIDPNNLMALCVGYHELTEALACLANGVFERDVDEFDLKWEGPGEPGESRRAPYHNQHLFAMVQEKRLLVGMGFFWSVYEKTINKLFKK